MIKTRNMRMTPCEAIDNAARDMVLDLDADTVHAGPDGMHDKVCVDPVFAKSFDQVLDDLARIIGLERVEGVLRQAVGTPMRAWVHSLVASTSPLMVGEDEYGRIVPLPAPHGVEVGLAFVTGDRLDGYRIAGLLLGPDLVVDRNYRQMGIGSSLVAAALLYRDGLPTWDHDKPGYSYGGYDCVISGLRQAQESLSPEKKVCESPQP